MASVPASDALAFLEGLQPSRMVFDLRGFEALLAAIGAPQAEFPAIHVAGTNGKGSLCAIAEAVLRAAGLRTGRYTSPHLEHPRERICIAGTALSAAAFDATVLELRELIERRASGMPYTYFDFLTALAFQQFAAERVDVAVVETGLGGRLDSTRPCLPRVTCITPIGWDHMEILGDSLGAISGEKAGILRPGVPCVIGPQPPEAAAVLLARAREIGAPVCAYGRDFDAEVVAAERRGSRIRYHPLMGETIEVALPLAGAHQAENAACALAAVELFAGAPLDPAAVARGLALLSWPGRCEWSGDGRILLDGAHNSAGATALARYLRGLEAPVHLVWGMLRGKDSHEFFPALDLPLSGISLPRLADPRAQPPERLVALVGGTPVESLGEAVEVVVPRLLRDLDRQTVLCVTGSLTLVGEARRRLLPDTGLPTV